jgi:ankyrin repeat protein
VVGATRDGRTAFYHAVFPCNMPIFRHLLDAGADVNAPAAPGYGTAVELACVQGHLDFVVKLLECGANVNAPAARTLGFLARHYNQLASEDIWIWRSNFY